MYIANSCSFYECSWLHTVTSRRRAFIVGSCVPPAHFPPQVHHSLIEVRINLCLPLIEWQSNKMAVPYTRLCLVDRACAQIPVKLCHLREQVDLPEGCLHACNAPSYNQLSKRTPVRLPASSYQRLHMPARSLYQPLFSQMYVQLCIYTCPHCAHQVDTSHHWQMCVCVCTVHVTCSLLLKRSRCTIRITTCLMQGCLPTIKKHA